MKLALTIWMTVIGLSVLAQTPETPVLPRTQISLAPAKEASLTVTLGSTKYVLPAEMSQLDKAAREAGMELALRQTTPPYELRISSVTHEVVVEAAGFEG